MTRQNNHRPASRRNPNWTAGEEEIVIEEIGKNPTNLKASFFAAAEIIGRTPGAVSGHYYQRMVNNPDIIACLTIGRSSVVQNRKRLKEGESPIRILRSSWDRIVRRLFKR